MRRVVDSVILVLVVYSLGWPLVRGMVHLDEPREVRIVVEVRVPGLDVVPSAEVRIARSDDDAQADRWIVHASQQAGKIGADCTIEDGIPSAWVAVEIPGASLGLREISIAGDAAPIEIHLPTDTRIVTGRVNAANGSLTVTMRTCTDVRVLDVPCDELGRFVFALPGNSPDPTTISVSTEPGRTIAERELPVFEGIHDLGPIGE